MLDRRDSTEQASLKAVELLTIKDASLWASEYLKKKVTPSNISYLVQYGRIPKRGNDGNTCVAKGDLVEYYRSHIGSRELSWRKKLGEDLNWNLSFDYLREADTTKHVHRLHPYKGKFIPQLVEYFLDKHTDEFKKETYFEKGDLILDPFCGSGTTLVQANELGIHSIGVDISKFNALISNVKVGRYNLVKLREVVSEITHRFRWFVGTTKTPQFEWELLNKLNMFNSKHFPSPEFKRRVRDGEIDGDRFGEEKAREFLPTYDRLVKEHGIESDIPDCGSFLETWYIRNIRDEIDYLFDQIRRTSDRQLKKVLAVMLSRTIRSCRATTHSDLATLKSPILTTYYCSKHGKICKPLFSILSWWLRYSDDTIKRLSEFASLRTETNQICLAGDSREIDIIKALSLKSPKLAEVVRENGINGIFSSPPYVGMIDYHEQHAYAYDLLGFARKDASEIGPLGKGQGREAQKSYVQSIAEVLLNCRKYLKDDFHVFLVANDKFVLYPAIAEIADMRIVDRYKRPVLNRTERDKGAYSETIFHLMRNQ